ncbi:MAG TPA: cyclic nucleotide-binding domain-containing protein, partial [Solirubrobacteraceae bacterium]|nr:cyclic nucleotide-binding domain-containing protein [Solirubrobacteraceae bacterium]
MSHPSVDQLRPLDLFDECGEEELARWAQAAELEDAQAGTVLYEPGVSGAPVHLLLDGTLEALTLDADGREQPVGEHHAPTWVGAITAVTEGVSVVRMRTLTPAKLAVIPASRFAELALSQRRVAQKVIRAIRPVVTRVTAIEQNRERLASLGTMAAGLAHELNNPAAAARRAADDLAQALDVLGSTIGRFVESGIERAEAQQLVNLQREALARQAQRGALDGLEAADAEEALLRELEELGVPEAWRLAEPLASAGVDSEWLARVAALAGDATPAALQWVAASLAAGRLAGELKESTARMSKLVAAVKAYAYMDRGEVVQTDVHEDLENTLTILGHKLKHTTIEVVRDYDRTLPAITVHGSELNQVWTNLLDNAIDALGEQGTITLRTRRDGDALAVDVADDGPGIP